VRAVRRAVRVRRRNHTHYYSNACKRAAYRVRQRQEHKLDRLRCGRLGRGLGAAPRKHKRWLRQEHVVNRIVRRATRKSAPVEGA
jgi:hypothetical protein